MQHTRVIFAFQLAGETKICNLQDEKLWKENVFRFDVSVSVSFLMQIVKSIHHLMEISSGNFFWEFARFGNEVKKFSSSHVFQHNGEAIVSGFIFFFVSGVFSDTDEFN